MKNIYLIIISSLLLNYGRIAQAQEAQKPASSDSALSEKICGIWLVEEDSLNGNAHRSVRVNLATNGEYTADVKTTWLAEGPAKGTKTARTSMGTWLVKDGCLVMTKLKTRSGDGDFESLSKPEVSTNKVARVTGTNLIFISELTGREQAWNRGN